jgi:hypothetical protein
MLSMCSVSAAQAETYYDKDDYYTQALWPIPVGGSLVWSRSPDVGATGRG